MVKIRIFAFIIFTSIIFSGCSNEDKIDPVTDIQWKIFSYLPSETQFVMFMNLNELRETEFWGNYFNPSLKDKSYNWLTEFEKETGVGFNCGVSQIFTSSSWNGNNTMAILFDKNFERIQIYFTSSGNFTQKQINGKEVFELKNETPSKFYFVNDSTLLVLSDENYLKEIISGENASLKKNKKLIDIIKSIKIKNHYWLATDQGTYAEALIEKLIGYNDLPVKDLINSIKNITLAAEFDDGVEIESNWGCSDSRKAYLLSAAIRGALAMNLLSNGDPVLEKTLDKVEVERNKTKINLHLNLNEDDIKELKNSTVRKNLNRKL